ncbi:MULTISPECIES: hypothetical protein [Pseudomonas]|uniref:hypothetical protein n=1 Tax=Pseudomonas TaxID=286 RepID=UPI0028998D5D|nr:hypothetical protein [Pseudomonas sp.]
MSLVISPLLEDQQLTDIDQAMKAAPALITQGNTVPIQDSEWFEPGTALGYGRSLSRLLLVRPCPLST